MKNDTRNYVFNRYPALRIGLPVALLTLYVSQAFADVPHPPPPAVSRIDTSFPSGQALKNQGYDPKTGVLRVNPQKVGNPTVSSNGGTLTATQNYRVTVTDNFGNKATMPSRVTQAVNAGFIASVVGGGLSNGFDAYGDRLINDVRNGRYSDAVGSAAGMAASVVDSVGFGLLFSFARFLNNATGMGAVKPNDAVNTANLRDMANSASAAQSAAEKSGDIGGAVANAAVQKAANAAANAAAQSEAARQKVNEAAKRNQTVYYVLLEVAGTKGQKDEYPAGVYTDKRPSEYGNAQTAMAIYDKDGKRPSIVHGKHLDLAKYLPSTGYPNGHAAAQWRTISQLNINSATRPYVNPQNMTLSGDEVKDILRRMFASQQTNHDQMMKQLEKIASNTAPNKPDGGGTQSSDGQSSGGQLLSSLKVYGTSKNNSVVDAATTSVTVNGSTVTTAPYTPAGSSQAQQTQFTMNSDGSVTASVIPRPDLQPNSHQAPTRQSVAPNTNTPSVPNQNNNQPSNTNSQQGQQGQYSQQNQQQNQQQREFCRENPRAAQCMEAGDVGYEDLEIPQNEINLDFKPADIFQTDGVCPAPKVVDLGFFGSVEFGYDMFCDFARKIRPIFIAMTVLMCAYFAYESVREV